MAADPRSAIIPAIGISAMRAFGLFHLEARRGVTFTEGPRTAAALRRHGHVLFDGDGLVVALWNPDDMDSSYVLASLDGSDPQPIGHLLGALKSGGAFLDDADMFGNDWLTGDALTLPGEAAEATATQ